MFLSRVELDWSQARNPYNMHRAVWTLFPGQERESRNRKDEERAGFLFRVEDSSAGKPARLLVQSRITPQLPGNGIRVIDSREFNPQPSAGQQLAFLLTANPVKTIVDENGRQNGKGEPKKCRVPLLTEEQQLEWLDRQLTSGARLVRADTQSHPPLFFHRKGKGGNDKNHNGKLQAVTYQGEIEVTDPSALLKLMHDGIGPAKAFGCGLMLVRRLG
jgi:CRISPR system Cascade subunit CasE